MQGLGLLIKGLRKWQKGESTYYKIISQNPKAYEEELQLFVVKPFYNFIGWSLFKLGFSASASISLISVISYALILVLIFSFLIKILRNYPLAFILTVLISLFKPLPESVRHVSADSLSCLLLLLSFLCVFSEKKFLLQAYGLCFVCLQDLNILFLFIPVFPYLFYRNSFQIKTGLLLVSYGYIFLSFFFNTGFQSGFLVYTFL